MKTCWIVPTAWAPVSTNSLAPSASLKNTCAETHPSVDERRAILDDEHQFFLDQMRMIDSDRHRCFEDRCLRIELPDVRLHHMNLFRTRRIHLGDDKDIYSMMTSAPFMNVMIRAHIV